MQSFLPLLMSGIFVLFCFVLFYPSIIHVAASEIMVLFVTARAPGFLEIRVACGQQHAMWKVFERLTGTKLTEP